MHERRWVRKWRLDAETDGLSPLPMQVVSNEEYIPLSQTGEQERVAALLQETARTNARWLGVMKTRHAGDLVIVASVVLVLVCSWITPALAQAPPGRFASVVSAARAWPGCLGVETGQTSSGKQVIFAWFENKRALVGWYHSEVHQKAMKTAFPNQTFDREPLPDTPEDSGPILAIVSLKLLDTPRPDAPSMPIATIGIELYTPLPGGVAVGGRFAPEAIKVRGLREIDLGSAQGRPR